MNEESRAQLYRQQQAAGLAARRVRQALLAGSVAARAALEEAWRPLTGPLRWDPPQD